MQTSIGFILKTQAGLRYSRGQILSPDISYLSCIALFF